jgi:chromosome segregation protein
VNCQRLRDALKEYACTTQFLIITHNKITMGLADTIYGVTMRGCGIRKLVSMKFQEIEGSGLLEKTG